MLAPLYSSGQGADYAETLSVFLLDSHQSIDITAKTMHLHPSTVKYRLKTIQQKLHRDTKMMPDVLELYMAVAMNRALGIV
ncbi:MAG: helix-turn-helix domain-containing protein [Clostridiales bacterium]|nr:helix-turn-helix domain-containing protein [Clostridiales bacterium]